MTERFGLSLADLYLNGIFNEVRVGERARSNGTF